jgi:hypothetical protein
VPLQLARVRTGPRWRRVGGNLAEDFHAVLLAIDEAVALGLVEGMRALDFVAFLFDGGGEVLFHFGLRGLAGSVGGDAEVATGDEVDDFLGGHGVVGVEGLKIRRRGSRAECRSDQVGPGSRR